MPADLYKYGVAVHLYKPIIKRAVVDFAVSADWTPAAGDVKISKDGGAAANVTNLPTAITMGNTAMWDFSLTATEMQAAKVRITVSDSATKAVEDVLFEVDTYGNASAQHLIDLADGVRAGLTALPNAAAEAAGGLYTRGSGAGQINQNASGQVDTRTVTMATDVITAAAIQADAIGAAEIANGAIDAATFAAGAIDAAAIATDALGALELAAGAATEIAAAVWDEARASHTTAGSFGQGVASVQGNVTGSVGSVTGAVGSVAGAVGSVTGAVGSVTGNVGGNVVGSVASVTAGVTVTTNNDKTGYALSAGGVTAVQSGLATSAAQATLQADTDDIQTRLPAALVSGRMDSSVGAMAAGVVTAAAVATDAIDSDALAASAVTEIAAGVAVGSAPTAADNAAAVWNAVAASFNTAGSMGQKLNAAGGAADPLSNAVPDGYVAGTAGYALGNLPQGNGPILWSYRVTRSDNGAGLPGVTIWVTSDAAGTARLAGPLVTDASGYVTPLLPAGTAYFWRFADRFTGPNPDIEVVS